MQTSASLDRLQQLLPELFNPQPRPGQIFLKFELAPDLIAAIPLDQVVETLRIPGDRLTPIPHMPAPMLGLMNSKGKVFWAIDLAEQLGVPASSHPDRYYEIIVVQISTASTNHFPEEAGTDSLDPPLLGLCVPHIRGTLRLTPADILPPISSPIATQLRPYLQGCARDSSNTIMILSIAEIC